MEPLLIFLKAMAVSVVVTFHPSITFACLNHLSDWVNVIWLPSEQVSPNLAKSRNWWWRLGNFHLIGLGDFTSGARLKDGSRRSAWPQSGLHQLLISSSGSGRVLWHLKRKGNKDWLLTTLVPHPPSISAEPNSSFDSMEA